MENTNEVREGRFERNGCYNYEVCKECKGKNCCAHFGCMYSPLDFIVLRDEKYTHEQRLTILTELVKLGKISIDMTWGKDTIFGPLHCMTKRPDIDKMSNGDGLLYLRARNQGRPIVDFQYFLDEKDYPCINWSLEKGCCLSEDERPYVGRMTKPRAINLSEDYIRYDCEAIGEVESIQLWAKHQLLMYDLYLNVRDLD